MGLGPKCRAGKTGPPGEPSRRRCGGRSRGISSAATTRAPAARAGAGRSTSAHGPATKDLPRRLLYFVCVKLIRLFLVVFCRWQVTGRGNVPCIGGTIIAPNHISYLDPPVAGSAFDRQIFFMAKAELFEVPFLGWLIRQYGAFPVRRGVADRVALRQAERLLCAGEAVMVFPEGTRSADGRLMPSELGIAMLALRTGATVLPIGVDGTDRAMPMHSLVIRPARVRIRIGPPLRFDDLHRGGPLNREVVEEAARRITAALVPLLPAWRTARIRQSPLGSGSPTSV